MQGTRCVAFWGVGRIDEDFSGGRQRLVDAVLMMAVPEALLGGELICGCSARAAPRPFWAGC